MVYKIVTTKDNIDALGTAGTVPNNQNYNSDYNTLKYYSQGTIQLGGSAAVGQAALYRGTVTHNLGYYPYTECMVQSLTDPTRYHLNSFRGAPAGPYVFDAFFSIGTTTILFDLLLANFDIFGTTTYGTVKFYYKIFRNNLGL